MPIAPAARPRIDRSPPVPRRCRRRASRPNARRARPTNTTPRCSNAASGAPNAAARSTCAAGGTGPARRFSGLDGLGCPCSRLIGGSGRARRLRLPPRITGRLRLGRSLRLTTWRSLPAGPAPGAALGAGPHRRSCDQHTRQRGHPLPSCSTHCQFLLSPHTVIPLRNNRSARPADTVPHSQSQFLTIPAAAPARTLGPTDPQARKANNRATGYAESSC